MRRNLGFLWVQTKFFCLTATVFENHRKSLVQHCERSELRLHFEWTKVNKKCQKLSILASFWKPEACGQTVLPDRSVLIGQKLVKNAKLQKFKCDILGDFQTMCTGFASHLMIWFLHKRDTSQNTCNTRGKSRRMSLRYEKFSRSLISCEFLYVKAAISNAPHR